VMACTGRCGASREEKLRSSAERTRAIYAALRAFRRRWFHAKSRYVP
jgi:hypothetical protein